MKPEFCFVAAVPGSSWSMLSHRLKILLDHDLSDMTDDRQQSLFLESKVRGQMISHYGSYFGPHNEFGQHFDDIAANYTLDQFYRECRRPFQNDGEKTRSVRSHWFSYNLDWLWENCRGNTLFLIHKEDQASVNWWLERGGWEIKHPVYDWYENTARLTEQIRIENSYLLDFAQRRGLTWEGYQESWWLERFGAEEITEQYRPPRREYESNPISVIYTTIE